MNDIRPMYSHIVPAQKENDTSEDGVLEAWEMKDLNLNAELVILSACETARGRSGSGEGVIRTDAIRKSGDRRIRQSPRRSFKFSKRATRCRSGKPILRLHRNGRVQKWVQ